APIDVQPVTPAALTAERSARGRVLSPPTGHGFGQSNEHTQDASNLPQHSARSHVACEESPSAQLSVLPMTPRVSPSDFDPMGTRGGRAACTTRAKPATAVNPTSRPATKTYVATPQPDHEPASTPNQAPTLTARAHPPAI